MILAGEGPARGVGPMEPGGQPYHQEPGLQGAKGGDRGSVIRGMTPPDLVQETGQTGAAAAAEVEPSGRKG